MNKTLKKALQFGVGSFYMFRDKAEVLVSKLRNEGVFDEKESKEVVKEAVVKAQDSFSKTAKTVKTKIGEIKSKSENGMNSKKDEVEKEVEEQVQEAKSKVSSKKPE